jgi:hypothetical protein
MTNDDLRLLQAAGTERTCPPGYSSSNEATLRPGYT